MMAELWRDLHRYGQGERAKYLDRKIPGSERICSRVKRPLEPINTKEGLKIPGMESP